MRRPSVVEAEPVESEELSVLLTRRIDWTGPVQTALSGEAGGAPLGPSKALLSGTSLNKVGSCHRPTPTSSAARLNKARRQLVSTQQPLNHRHTSTGRTCLGAHVR